MVKLFPDGEKTLEYICVPLTLNHTLEDLEKTESHLKTICHRAVKTENLAGSLFARLQLDCF